MVAIFNILKNMFIKSMDKTLYDSSSDIQGRLLPSSRNEFPLWWKLRMNGNSSS